MGQRLESRLKGWECFRVKKREGCRLMLTGGSGPREWKEA